MKTMKKLNILLASVAVVLMALACQPEEVEPIGDAFDRSTQITGTWNLTTATMVDTDAVRKGFPASVQTVDITTIVAGVDFTDFSITINADGSFSTTKGSAPIEVPDNGTWAFDNAEFPSALVLTSGATSVSLNIASFANITSGQLTFGLTRSFDNGNNFLRYEYAMTQAN